MFRYDVTLIKRFRVKVGLLHLKVCKWSQCLSMCIRCKQTTVSCLLELEHFCPIKCFPTPIFPADGSRSVFYLQSLTTTIRAFIPHDVFRCFPKTNPRMLRIYYECQRRGRKLNSLLVVMRLLLTGDIFCTICNIL